MQNKFFKKLIAFTVAVSMSCSSISVPVFASAAQEQSTPSDSSSSPDHSFENIVSQDDVITDDSSTEGTVASDVSTISDESLVGSTAKAPEDESVSESSVAEEIKSDDGDDLLSEDASVSEETVGGTEGSGDNQTIENGVYLIIDDTVTHFEKDCIQFYVGENIIPFEYDNETGRIWFSSDYNGQKIKAVVKVSDEKTVEQEFVYSSESIQNVSLALDGKTETYIYVENASLAYGDTASIKDACKMNTNTDASLAYTVTEGSEFLEIDESGNITGIGVGKAVVSIHADAGDNYTECDAAVEITVTKRDLGEISILDVSFNNDDLTRVYDGTSEFDISGTINISDSKKISVLVTVNRKTKNEGTEETTVKGIRLADTDDESNVSFTYNKSNEEGPNVKVTARPIQIAFKDKESVEEGDVNQESISHVFFPREWFKDITVTGASEELIESDDLIESITAYSSITSVSPTTKPAVNDKSFIYEHGCLRYTRLLGMYCSDGNDTEYTGEIDVQDGYAIYKDAISLALLDGSKIENYTLSLSEGSSGDIYVYENLPNGDETEEPEPPADGDEAWETLKSRIKDSASDIYLFNDIIYIRPGGKIYFNPYSYQINSYNELCYEYNGETYTNMFVVPDDAPEGSFCPSYYIRNKKSGAVSQSFTVPVGQIIVDGTAPSVSIDELGQYNRENQWSIEVFSNSIEEFKINIEDALKEDPYSTTGKKYTSGIKYERYSVYNVESDEDLNNLINGIINDEYYLSWSDVPSDRIVPIQKTADENVGYQILIIWTRDNAGNSVLVTSNGVVIDTTSPEVEFQDFDTSLIYEQDVSYKLKINDNNQNTHSGIESVDVSVKVDGVPLESHTVTSENISEEGILSNSYFIDTSGVNAITGVSGTTIPEIEKLTDGFTLNGTINVDGINSNNVVIEVTVKDKSGNTFTNSTDSFVIDTVLPVIDISVSEDVSNERYYKDACTLTVTYKERNFDAKRASADININQPLIIYDGSTDILGEYDNIDDVADRDESIKLVSVSDSQGGYSQKDFTDERTVTYVFKLGDKENIENLYQWSFSYEDIKGDCLALSVDKSGIYVDNIAPQLSLSLTNEENNEISAKSDIGEIIFYNQNISAELTVEDSFFDAFEDGSFNIDNTASGEWNDNVYTCVYTTDAAHHIHAEIYDLAGNKSEIDTLYFGVDKTAPTGIVVREDDDSAFDSFVSTLRDVIFKNQVTKYTVNDVSDNVSGVKSVEYYLDTSNDSVDKVLSIEELKLFTWEEYASEIKIDKNQQATVYVRITDNAGNVTYINTDGVIVDAPQEGSPLVSVSIDKEASGYYTDDLTQNGYYTDDIYFNIYVKEPNVNGVYSGIKYVSWYVVSDGVTTQELKETTYNEARKSTSVTVDGVIIKELNESDNVSVVVKSVDYAGNETTKSFSDIKVDITPPDVSARYDNNDAANSKYFKDTRTLTMNIKESHLNMEQSGFYITCNGVSGFYTIDDLINGAVSAVDTKGFKVISDDEYSIDVTFGKENSNSDFIVYPYIIDDAGLITSYSLSNANSSVKYYGGTKAESIFTVDTIKPTIGIKYTMSSKLVKSGSGSKDAPLYDRVSITPSFTVTDDNIKTDLYSSTVQVSVDGYDNNGDAVEVSGSYASLASDLNNWSINDKTASYEMKTFTDDANYQLGISVTDLAGNKSTVQYQYFTIDKTPAYGKLTNENEGSIFTTFAEAIKDYIFSKDTVEFTITDVGDETSGVDQVLYYVSPSEMALTVEELEAKTFEKYEDAIVLPKDSQSVVYAKLTDKAGNVTYINDENLIIIDSHSPDSPLITIKTEPSNNGIYTGDIDFHVDVTDPENDGTYSGLKSVKWYVETLDGEITQSGAVNFENRMKRIQTTSFDDTISAEKNDLHDVYLFVVATDYAENTTKKQYESIIHIDQTNPSVDISYNNNSVKNEKYFNGNRIMTCEITETNFVEEGLTFDIIIDGKKGTYSVDDIKNEKAADVTFVNSSSEGAIHTYELEFGGSENTEHNYKVYVNVEDSAGNKNIGNGFSEDTAAGDNFTIDKIFPNIEFIYNSDTFSEEIRHSSTSTEDVESPIYSRDELFLVLSINETNLIDDNSSADIALNLTCKNYEGNDIFAYNMQEISKAQDVSNWTEDKGNHLFLYGDLPNFTQSANYGLTLSVEDLAGNKTKFGPDYFTIDSEKPSGTLYHINDTDEEDTENIFTKLAEAIKGFIYSKENIVYRVKDIHDEISGVAKTSYYIDANNKVLSEAELSKIAFTDYSKDILVPVESQGVVYIKIEDNAGNIAYISSDKLSVADKTKPNAPEITITTEKPKTNYYTSDVEFSVHVEDPTSGGTYSGIKDVTWYVEADGQITQPKTDYADELSDSRHKEWNFTGVISSEINNNSSNIYVHVIAEDNAGNKTDNVVSERVQIDVTKPVLTVSYDNNDVRNGLYFNKERVMTCEVDEKNFENQNIKFEVTIDGETKTYTIDELANVGSGISVIKDNETDTENSDIHRYQIGFGVDEDIEHTYKIIPSVWDDAENKNEGIIYTDDTANEEFVIDKIDPVISTVYSCEQTGISVAGADINGILYDQTSITPTLTVIDKYLNENTDKYGTLKINLTATDSGNNDISKKDSSGNIISPYSYISINKAQSLDNIGSDSDKWQHSGSTHTCSMDTFTVDANYAMEITVYDLAGNKGTLNTEKFTVDGTPPKGAFKSLQDTDKTIFDKFVTAFKGFIFHNKNIEFEVTSTSDEISGIENVYYYTNSSEVIITEDELNDISFDLYDGIFTIPKKADGKKSSEGQGIAYVKIVDKAGNITYINSSKLAVADKTSPEFIKDGTDGPNPITILTDKAKNNFYTEDVKFKIHVKDPVSGDTYAGLDNIQWYITDKDPESPSKSDTRIISSPFENKTKRVQEYTATEDNAKTVIPISKYDSNFIYLTITATDNAGNSINKTTTTPIRIDATKPIVSVSYDNDSPNNGKYFNKARTMIINITEKNFKTSGLTFDITIDNVKNTYRVQDIKDGKAKGVSFVSYTDTGKQDSDYNSKNRNITYKIGFGLDGKTDHDYVVVPHVVDLAGNVGDITYENTKSSTNKSFTIDEIAPVLSVDYTGGTSGKVNCSTNAAAPSYDRASMTVNLTVKERNFIADKVKSNIDITVSSVDVNKNPVSAYADADIQSAENASTWSNKDNTHTKKMNTFVNDANYTFSMTVSDLAGNVCSTYAPRYFTVDKTPPTGSITTGAQGLTGIFKTFYEKVKFWFFDNKGIDVNRTAEDSTSGVASIKYYIWEPGAEARNTFSGLSVSTLSGLNWTDWASTLRVNPDKGGIVYERIEDKAGNVTYINTEGGVISEGTAPAKPVIQISTSEPANGIYNGNVPFTITVSDQENGGTYSGLKSVSYQVTNNGTVTQSGNYDNELTDRTARVKTVQKSETIDAQKNNSNHVKIEVTATDYAGNTSTESKEIMIDITAPVIDITYDYNNPRNGKYYNVIRTATIHVKERNFNPGDFTISTSEVRGANPVISGWSLAGNMGESDEAVSTCTVSYETDGDYTLTASCQDKAGNKAVYDRVDNFVIDRTAPVIEVSFDNNDARYQKYYKDTRNATIKVNDRFMEVASDFHSNISAALDGEPIEIPSLTGWSNGNDSATNGVSFTKDGDYVLEFTCVDLAGNEAKVYRSEEFTIDKTAPEISFFNIENKSANRGVVKPGIKYFDRNFTAEEIVLQLMGTRHDTVSPDGVREYNDVGGIFTLNDIEHISSADDIYTLVAFISDKAGNTTKQTLRFSVNRYGSVYSFDDIMKNILSRYYLKDISDFTITETNADILKDQSVTISRDGEILSIIKGKDYTIFNIDDDGSWKIYNYNFKKSLFEKEGLYEIRINSKDAAGNDQDNQLKNEPIRFIIDHTAPSVSYAKISDNGRYKETRHSFEINVSDNFAFGEVELYVDGVGVKTYTNDDITKANGRLSYTLNSANDWQEIRIVARDAAGNKSKDKTIRVLITTNKFLQFRENKPLFYGTIAALLGILGLIFFLIYKRKKKKESDETDELQKSTDELEKTTDDIAQG